MSPNITLALVRQASVFESLANGFDPDSERERSRLVHHRGANGRDMSAEIRDRLGRNFRRDFSEEMDGEFLSIALSS